MKDLAFAMSLVRRLRVPKREDGAVQCTRLSAMFRVAKEADINPELVMRLIVAGQRADLVGIAVSPDASLTRLDLLHLEPADTTNVAIGWVGPDDSVVPDVAMAAAWLADALHLSFGDFYRHDDTPIKPSDDALGG